MAIPHPGLLHLTRARAAPPGAGEGAGAEGRVAPQPSDSASGAGPGTNVDALADLVSSSRSARDLRTRNRAQFVALILVAAIASPTSTAQADSNVGGPITDVHREWVWSSYGVSTGGAGVVIGDVDGDGSVEILSTSLATTDWFSQFDWWHQSRMAGELRQTWSALPALERIQLLRLVPAQGFMEILVVSATRADVFSGRTGRLVRSIYTGATEILDAQVGDLDGSGELEVVFCDEKALFIHDFASGAELDVRYGFGCTEAAIGQTDGDPQLEIALAGNALGGFVLDGQTLGVQWAHLAGFGPRIRLTDVDHDGSDEIIAQSSGADELNAIEPSGSGVPLWTAETGELGVFETGDVDGDGDEEILYGNRDASPSGTVRVLDEMSGAPLWHIDAPPTSVRALAIGDVDGDEVVDLVWSGASQYFREDSRLHVADVAERKLRARSPAVRGPFLGIADGDVDGDGRKELATAGAAGSDADGYVLETLVFDTDSRSVTVLATTDDLNDSSEFEIRTVLAQLDGDSQLEICSAYRAVGEGTLIRCVDPSSGALEWQVGLPDYEPVTALLVAELDGDSTAEIVVSTQHPAVFAFEGETGWLKWRTPQYDGSAHFSTLRVGDVIGSSAPEIVAGGGWDTAGLAVIDGLTGLFVVPVFDQEPGGGMSFDLAQWDADASLEILRGDFQGEIRIFDPVAWEVGPPLFDLGVPIRSLRVGDITRDGVSDIVFSSATELRLVDGASQSVTWTSPYLGTGAGVLDSLWIGNFDADPMPEILVNTTSGFALFEAPLAVSFTDGFESGDLSAWSSSAP